MDIKFYPRIQYTPSFSSKSPEIRRADDIQRKTRTAFPFFSPKYAADYYSSCTPFYNAPNTQKAIEHWNNIHHLDQKASKMASIRRDRMDNLIYRDGFASKFMETYCDIRKYGLANCEEAATMTLASLIANGYQNSFKCALKLTTSIYEKGSKNPKFEINDSIDHAVVLSTMDKNPDNKDKYYVLDSWYGFADSISGAKARYKQLTDVNKFNKSRQKAINKFTCFYENKYKNFDINNFEIRQNINFDLTEIADKYDNSTITELYKAKFPELILE